jgi:hypothetical protein
MQQSWELLHHSFARNRWYKRDESKKMFVLSSAGKGRLLPSIRRITRGTTGAYWHNRTSRQLVLRDIIGSFRALNFICVRRGRFRSENKIFESAAP